MNARQKKGTRALPEPEPLQLTHSQDLLDIDIAPLVRLFHNLRAPWLDLCSSMSFPSPAIRPVLAAVSNALLKQISAPSSRDLVRNMG